MKHPLERHFDIGAGFAIASLSMIFAVGTLVLFVGMVTSLDWCVYQAQGGREAELQKLAIEKGLGHYKADPYTGEQEFVWKSPER